MSPKLPAAVDRSYPAFEIAEPGWWLCLSDTHFPYHDPTTIELAIAAARKRKAVGVLLNGDLLDSHGLSKFDKDPSAPRYCEEIKVCKGFLEYLRHKLPSARIVFKEGNHDERLNLYVMRNAEALFGLELLTLSALLDLKQFGVEHVGDKRVIRFGKLAVIHGHEYPAVNNPVNPARGLFLRAKSVALCGHFHQTSEHFEPDIRGYKHGAWSQGCACQLNPRYAPLNKWNHGFAMIQLEKGGNFSVDNMRVIDGKAV